MCAFCICGQKGKERKERDKRKEARRNQPTPKAKPVVCFLPLLAVDLHKNYASCMCTDCPTDCWLPIAAPFSYTQPLPINTARNTSPNYKPHPLSLITTRY